MDKTHQASVDLHIISESDLTILTLRSKRRSNTVIFFIYKIGKNSTLSNRIGNICKVKKFNLSFWGLGFWVIPLWSQLPHLVAKFATYVQTWKKA